MLRRLSLLPALVAVAATTAVAPAGATHGDRPPPVSRASARTASTAPPVRPADEGALAVTMESLSPSYLPDRGTVRVSGSVTNRSDETWRAINVYAFIGETPITSSAALAAQGEVESTEEVGDRITVPGTFDRLDELLPGASAQFSIEVPRSAIDVTAAGAYWFGVHALGETDAGRDVVADGRARTFIPVVPRSSRRVVDTALVIPVRRQVQHTEDGAIDDVEGWARDLDQDGALRSLVDFGASAGSRPVTWLVDPAVPDAVRRLVAGNPARSLADTVGDDDGQGDGEESPSPDATAEPAPTAPADPDEDVEPEPEPNAATEPGEAWLDRLREAATGDEILALPYGDVDVAAALEFRERLYQQARKRSGSELEPWGLPTSPAVHAPDGYLDPEALAGLHRWSRVLVGEQMFADRAPAVARARGHRLLPTSTAGAGGPGPDDPLGPVALRQQILSEAAVRLADGDTRPLVVVLPDAWTPPGTTGFFDGLDVDWLRLTEVDDLADRPATPVPPSRLAYPERQSRLELDGANFASAQALIRSGEVLQNVLLRNDQVASSVRDEALTGLSYSQRARPDAARAAADRSRAWVTDQLSAISVEAPRAVTLSSSSGRFAATLTNELDHPVTVRLQAITDEPMQIEGPPTIEIPANSATSVLLDAATDRLGVSNVQLVVTDEAGTPLGSSDSLPIRSVQVSQVIWVILGTGVALLFGAIAVRLVRRIRRATA